MTYDQWKTRSPDDERFRFYPYDYEDERPECTHPYGFTSWSLLTGQATCRSCGEKIPRCESPPFVDRVLMAWADLRFWIRWDVWWAVKRPFRAVRSWWRGWRTAPWKPDDEVPF